jgi:ABC-type transport system involved in cytochrome bd biosynthesis fused ATPase/permease subunit
VSPPDFAYFWKDEGRGVCALPHRRESRDAGSAHETHGEGVAPEFGAAETLLEVSNIEVIYNHVILVLKGVSLKVPKGGITALLGGNGAGKTTTLKAISNLLHSERGEVTKGSIRYRGEPVADLSPSDLVDRGVIQVMEGRHCFEHLTVEENLLTGSYTRKDGRGAIDADLEMVYSYFPAEGAAEEPGGLYLGRRAADDRDRPGADVAGPRRSCWTSRRWGSRRSWWSRSSTS